jgi:hypothetical protein
MTHSKGANGKRSHGHELRDARLALLNLVKGRATTLAPSVKTSGAALDDAAMGKAQRTPDPWFVPSLGPANARAHLVLVPVMQAMERYGRKRAMKAADRRTLYRTLIPVVANLIYHQLNGRPGDGVPVPRAKKAHGKKASRYEPFVFPRSFPKMLDTLCVLGFAVQTKGSYSGLAAASKLTTVRSGPKIVTLIEQHGVTFDDLDVGQGGEVIILKAPKRDRDGQGARIDYRDTPVSRQFREELQALNAWLEKADIRFNPGNYTRPVDVRARRLFRYFDNGSFESGGRLYRGFWQNLPSEVRHSGITIDGERVVEMDYAQLNPMLAYSEVKGSPPQGDSYVLPGFEGHRDGVKKVFNAMLFDRGPRAKFPKGGVNAMFPRGTKVSEIIRLIHQKHPMLGSVLSAGRGHRLMFLESQIMMCVLQHLREVGVVALPVFDAVIVKASTAVAVEAVMRGQFQRFTGLVAEVNLKSAPASIGLVRL